MRIERGFPQPQAGERLLDERRALQVPGNLGQPALDGGVRLGEKALSALGEYVDHAPAIAHFLVRRRLR
jgi:hypothetical protein